MFLPQTTTSGATSRSARPTGSAAAVTAMLAAIDTQGAVLSRPSVDGDSVPFMQVLACVRGGGYESSARGFREGVQGEGM